MYDFVRAFVLLKASFCLKQKQYLFHNPHEKVCLSQKIVKQKLLVWTWLYLLLYSVSPGNVWTPLWDEYASGEADKDKAIKDGEKAQV